MMIAGALLAFQGGGWFRPLRAGGLGDQRWLVHCTPHFLFFCIAEKEKTGRARFKREKDLIRGLTETGARLELGGQVRMIVPAAWCGRGWVVEESSLLLFPLALACYKWGLGGRRMDFFLFPLALAWRGVGIALTAFSF